MEIKHTGLLITEKKKINIKNKENSLSHCCVTNDAYKLNGNIQTRNNSMISFGAGFLSLPNIKELFALEDKIEPNTTINTATAKKIIIKELEKENVRCKQGHISELLHCNDKLTPDKAKILAKLYIIQLKEDGDYKKPYNQIHQEMRFFCNKDETVNRELFEKMYNLQKFELANKNYWKSDNIRMLTLNCKDRNGYHHELLDLYSLKNLNEYQIKHTKINGVIYKPIIDLLKAFAENRANVHFKEALKSTLNHSQQPNILAINSLKEKVKDYRDDIIRIIDYINYSKDKQGNYQQDSEELLKQALEARNKQENYLHLGDLWDNSLDDSKKRISKEKLAVNIEALNLFQQDDSRGIPKQYIARIGGKEERLDVCKELKKTLTTPNMNNVQQALARCISKNKGNNIDKESLAFIKEVEDIYKLEFSDLMKLLAIVQKKDIGINNDYYKLIAENQRRSNIDISVIIELAEIYIKTYKDNPKLLNKFNKYVDAYASLVKKYYKDYILSTKTDVEIKEKYGSEENIKIDYNDFDGENFKSIATYMLAKTLTEEGISPIKLEIIDIVSTRIGIDNMHKTLRIFKDLTSKDFIAFLKLLELAKENKQTLRDGVEDLTDFDIEQEFISEANVLATQYQRLGEKLFTHAFNLKFDNFMSFISDAEFISDYWYEYLQAKFFPEQTKEYISAKNEIAKLKKQLSQKIKPEQKAQQKQNKEQIEKLKKEISVLKLRLKEAPQDENARKVILEKNAKIKELTNKIQKFYKNANLKDIIENINKNQKLVSEYDNGKISDPNEIIKHIRTIASIHCYFEQEDTLKYIKMMSQKDVKSKKELTNFIHNKIFEKMDIEYTDTLAKYLDFSKSKYLSNLIQEDDDNFWDSFTWLCNALDDEYAKSAKEILDNVESNIGTKKIFKSLGIDYDKWTTVDQNSYVKVEVVTDLEKAKQSTIKNLEEDLNSDLWEKLPIEESEKIFTAIKNAGFEFKENTEAVYDAYGYETGTQIIKRLYKDNKPIEFEDTIEVITAIKSVMNKSNFWNYSLDETEERTPQDVAKGTLLTHILKMRAKEFENATTMIDNELITLEVHKTDMNNVPHALFLGNHAGCCTAIGSGCNSWSAPEYIINKCISSIEVMDGKNFVGNTMCFIAEIDGELSLVLDNIELNTKYQYNEKIRDAIIEYAKKLCNEIGRPDLKIYAGPNRHKVNLDKYELKEHKMHIKGYSSSEVLIDSIDAIKISPNRVPDKVNLYKIR